MFNDGAVNIADFDWVCGHLLFSIPASAIDEYLTVPAFAVDNADAGIFFCRGLGMPIFVKKSNLLRLLQSLRLKFDDISNIRGRMP